jgi:hypothetical protein
MQKKKISSQYPPSFSSSIDFSLILHVIRDSLNGYKMWIKKKIVIQ